jgi:hypothetical protein
VARHIGVEPSTISRWCKKDPSGGWYLILTCAEATFGRIFNKNEHYRSTGVGLAYLEDCTVRQRVLFGVTAEIEKTAEVYKAIDAIREKYGKHTIFLGSSFLAHRHKQHEGERGAAPERTQQLLIDRCTFRFTRYE